MRIIRFGGFMKKKLIMVALVALATLCALSAESLNPYKVTGAYELSPANVLTMVGDEYSDGYATNSRPATLLYNLKNRYKTVTMTVGVSDDSTLDKENTLEIYVDNVLVETHVFKGGDFPEEFEIDLNYQRQLKIVLEPYSAIKKNGMILTNVDFK